MITNKKTTFLSAAAIAVAVLATAAVSRTTQTQGAAPAQVTSDRVTGAITGSTPSRPGRLICGMALDADCAQLDTYLPM